MDKPVYSVSDLNRYVKTMLESDGLLRSIAVSGEISNFKRNVSGHLYFSLKDASASVTCAMFRGSADKLLFEPENGMKVIAAGRVSLYPQSGVYQLVVERLIPDGKGDLQAAYEQLKAKLEAEGLFDRSHKKPLPLFPKCIAVITSGTGAAVMDIIRVLRKRWPISKIKILPVAVQGEKAPAQIAGALKYANKWHIADVIICGRGGGSLEDLWCFNDERVARAIYESEIPVISAVGHEPDYTIADFVADRRAATPSNAAELAVPDRYEQLQALDETYGYLGRMLDTRLDAALKKLKDLQNRYVLSDPSNFVSLRSQQLLNLQKRLESAETAVLLQKTAQFQNLAGKLDALSPLKVLSRGYSMVEQKDGRIVRSINNLKIGESLKLSFADGGADCRVTDIRKDNNYGRTEV
ncbi:MAG: exodeoxyribonuclease VII large subunit [Oscillospiraceae bacterium]|nr:exodeoxyribonuclease VII large subunit [Oscillospiraceae bacterium]